MLCCRETWRRSKRPRAHMVSGLHQCMSVPPSAEYLHAAGGITHNVSETVVATVIADGAHHLDLMASHADDPASVVAARRSHMRHIRRWVDDWYKAAGGAGPR